MTTPEATRQAFWRELDDEERLRAIAHPIVCETDHDRQTATEHWRCVMVAAALVVPAYDRLRTIERRARALLTALDGHDAANIHGWSEALRAALDEESQP